MVELQAVEPGAFLGNPESLKWFQHPQTRAAVAQAGLTEPAAPADRSRLYLEAKKIPSLLPPAVYFPYNKMGQSASGFACDTSGG